MSKNDHSDSAPKWTELFNDLREKGYVHTFYRDPERLYCVEAGRWILPSDFDIDESYYFTNGAAIESDRLVYAITAMRKLKGVLIDASGVYNDNVSDEMMHKLNSVRQNNV